MSDKSCFDDYINPDTEKYIINATYCGEYALHVKEVTICTLMFQWHRRPVTPPYDRDYTTVTGRSHTKTPKTFTQHLHHIGTAAE